MAAATIFWRSASSSRGQPGCRGGPGPRDGETWSAVGGGVEEAAQETAEWCGGAFLFGKIYSPVIIEGQLISVADGRAICCGTELAISNRKAIKALPKEDQGKREVRLRLAAEKAATDYVKKIDKKAWANLKNAGVGPG